MFLLYVTWLECKWSYDIGHEVDIKWRLWTWPEAVNTDVGEEALKSFKSISETYEPMYIKRHARPDCNILLE